MANETTKPGRNRRAIKVVLKSKCSEASERAVVDTILECLDVADDESPVDFVEYGGPGEVIDE